MSDAHRYRVQELFAPLGPAGQSRLRHSYVTLIGCGALGCTVATLLVRAGIGGLRIVDRDFVELDNLPRQILFDEADAAEPLPKAEAAARKLRRANSAVEIEARIADVRPDNIESFCHDADLLLDGTDNVETRFLLNDVAHRLGLPCVFAACLGADGQVLAVRPGETACYRCLWEAPPPPGVLETCDTAGVLGPSVGLTASWQALAAMQILIGKADAWPRGLLVIHGWAGKAAPRLAAAGASRPDCPCCGLQQYDYLAGSAASATEQLCGREAIQISPPAGARLDLKEVAGRLPSAARPVQTPYLLRFSVDERTITVFPDGRAIIQGTTSPAVARSLYARYVGL